MPLSNESEAYLLDHQYCHDGISYAPSCQLLQFTRKQNHPQLSRLFAIQDPELNLPFANCLVENIVEYFSEEPQVLVRETATKEAFSTQANTQSLRLAHCLLFSCHGHYVVESPLESHLRLANETRLLLGEIFAFDLSQCNLVVLAACETGLTEPVSLSDEYIGLSSGFLFAGSPRVVSSLWEVNSVSTTLLMRKFYQNLFDDLHKQQQLNVVTALNKAQRWLRELTNEEYEHILNKELKPQINQIIEQLPPGKQRRFQASITAAERLMSNGKYPFASPQYWAAFTTNGL